MLSRYRILFATLLISLLGLASIPSHAQNGDLGDVIRAGAADAETIMKAYLSPVPSGLGANINSGWTNRAKTHKTLGFDLQIRAAAAFVPNSDQTFDINDLDLDKVKPADPANTISPTVGGNEELGPEVIIEENGDELTRFALPEGSGYSFVPSPMIQAGIGTIKNTDLIVRYIPKISADDVNFGMYGFGLKHDINQWLPGGKVLPLNISVVGGFTKINVDTEFDLKPETGAVPVDQNAANANFDDQNADISLNTFTLKALVGKDLPFISFYGGVGYETSTLDVSVMGDYPVSAKLNGINAYEVINDPFDYNADGSNKFSLHAGLNLKLAFFHIFGEYTLSNYSSASAGIAFSFR